MDAANHSLSNDIKPPKTSLILNTNQLDELTNQLKILSIDDLSINKIVENLKTIKTEPHVIDELQNFIQENGLFGFVLNQMTFTFDSKNLNINSIFLDSYLQPSYNSLTLATQIDQLAEEIININEHIKCNKKALVGTSGQMKQFVLAEQEKLMNCKARLLYAMQRLHDQAIARADGLIRVLFSLNNCK
ncbi:unnamed protein product [Meloidogyne enterolobii]|uniref:Uncharacterized protein n=1 Tax=Meloidogyne enterolobii TaxID=390850 RepID=A0ACB1A7S8_MELEN